MKSSKVLASLAVALITALCVPQASAQLNLANLGNLQKSLGGFKDLLGGSLGSLKDISKHVGSPEKLRSSVDGFLKNYDGLSSQRGGLRSMADDLSRDGAESMRDIERRIANTADPKQKQALTRQHEKTRDALNKTTASARSTQQRLSPYLDRMGGVAEKLRLDPSAAGVKSLGNSLDSLVKEGPQMLKSLGGLTKNLGGLSKGFGGLTGLIPGL